MSKKNHTEQNAYAHLAEKDPTPLHQNYADWLKFTTGAEIDVKTLQLATSLRHVFQRSPENQEDLERRRKDAENKKFEAEKRKADAEAKRKADKEAKAKEEEAKQQKAQEKSTAKAEKAAKPAAPKKPAAKKTAAKAVETAEPTGELDVALTEEIQPAKAPARKRPTTRAGREAAKLAREAERVAAESEEG